MALEISSQEPRYGENYARGYIGFTYYKTSLISRGITYFTRWDRMGDIRVSHALVVVGENECVEAHMQKGVVRSALSTYFNNSKCQIFFRKPVGLSPTIADRIVTAAEREVGKTYDRSLIISEAAKGTFLGYLINRKFGGSPDRLVSQLFNKDNRWICSELAAYVLDEQPEYKNKGCLSNPNETIDPQELFEDDVIFTPWHKS